MGTVLTFTFSLTAWSWVDRHLSNISEQDIRRGILECNMAIALMTEELQKRKDKQEGDTEDDRRAHAVVDEAKKRLEKHSSNGITVLPARDFLSPLR